MSQSDYIRYLKTSNQLLEANKLDKVLSSQDYISFKQYTLESNIVNTLPTLNQLAVPKISSIFDLQIKIASCPSIKNFPMCNQTQNRLNRRNNTIDYDCVAPVVNKHPEKRIS